MAATILPAQSEAVLVALLLRGEHPVATLVAVATVGNVLGSVVNWAIGRGLVSVAEKRGNVEKNAKLERATRWYRKYGKWSLLLSWAPIIGDPLTVAAGVMREPFAPFVALVTVAKLGRYVVLVLAVMGILR